MNTVYIFGIQSEIFQKVVNSLERTIGRMGVLTVLLIVLLSTVCLIEANWYGKRGGDVDDAFQRYLVGRLSKTMSLRGGDDKETLIKLSKILRDWQENTKTSETTRLLNPFDAEKK